MSDSSPQCVLAVLALLGCNQPCFHLLRKINDLDAKTKLPRCLGEPSFRCKRGRSRRIAKQKDHLGSGAGQERELERAMSVVESGTGAYWFPKMGRAIDLDWREITENFDPARGREDFDTQTTSLQTHDPESSCIWSRTGKPHPVPATQQICSLPS